MKSISNRLLLLVLCLAVVVAAVSVPKKTLGENQDASPAATCEQKVALVNYRSKLLTTYKQSEEKQYKVFRKKWATRITYAGQWVPKESIKARDVLYKYDRLHRALIEEVDKQIKEFQYLETDPLDCSDAKKNTRAIKLEEAKGLDGKKVVGGQALLDQKKKDETKYVNGKFKKVTDKMVKKLHDAKQKNPTPEKSMTMVDEPK